MIQNINLGAAPNDKTGTKARVAGQIINANFAYLEGKIDNVDKIVSETGFSLVDLVFTINAFWEWNLNGIGYTNPEAVSINIPLCASGKKRIDYIVPNSSNTFTIISGIETTGIPAAPSIPNKDMYVSFFTITDILIESPALTIIGENYISKLEKAAFQVYQSGEINNTVLDEFYYGYLNFRDAVTNLKSIGTYTNAHLYSGRELLIKNSQATDITIYHLTGTGFQFSFPNEVNFILKPNEIIRFSTKILSPTSGILEYVGVVRDQISDVVGLAEALGSKLDASAYNEHFKGKYTSSGALTTAYPTATDGDYAIVDAGTGVDAKEWIWDNEAGWIVGGATGASTTDALPEGSTNLYFTVGRFLTNLTLANIVAALGYTPSTAPNDAQKNSDITKAEIEAKLTGEIITHTHPSTGGSSSVITTVKNIISTDILTHDVPGIVQYINDLSPVLTLAATEIVEFQVININQIFRLNINGRSFGQGQPAITTSDVCIIKDINWDGLFPLKYLYQSTYSSFLSIGAHPIGVTGTVTYVQDYHRYSTKVSTGATAGSSAYIKEANVTYLITNRGFMYTAKIIKPLLSTSPNSRGFFGLAQHSGSIGNIDPSTYTGQFIGFGFDSSDTNLSLMYKLDSVITKTSLGVNFPKSDKMDILLKMYRFTNSNIMICEITNLINGAIYSANVNYFTSGAAPSVAISNHINNGTDAVAVSFTVEYLIMKQSN